MSAGDMLREAPEEINPALLMAWRLKERELTDGLDLNYLIEQSGAVEEAVRAGAAEVSECAKAVDLLRKSAAVPASVVPVGF